MSETEPEDQVSNLELIHWLDSDEWEDIVEHEPAASDFKSFEEVAQAIDEKGPICAFKKEANAFLFRTSGRFGTHIVGLRQSGLNVRRMLITRERFDGYGGFGNVMNHLLCNNYIGPEVEYEHLRDFASHIKLDHRNISQERHYHREEIDTIAVLQMLDLKDEHISENPDSTEFIQRIFDIGFTAGRNFSAIQNLMTLESEARAAMETRRKNVAKGLKSGSEKRKNDRLVAFIDQIEVVHHENPHLRSHEPTLLKIAFEIAVPPGSYGHGQFDEYCSIIRSDPPFKERFDALFRQLPK